VRSGALTIREIRGSRSAKSAARTLATLLVAAAPVALVWAQAPEAAATFDKVWTIVRDTHFDPSFDRATWDRAREELRPKAVAAKTPGELRGILREMLGRLGLSHFAVIAASPDAPGEHEDLNGRPGFEVRLIDKQLVVTAVDQDSAAAAAGVHPGWIVDAVGGVPMARTLAPIADGAPERIAQFEAWRLSLTQLRGPSSSTLDVTFIDGDGRPVAKSIRRTAEAGEPVHVGSLPTMYVRVRSSLMETPGGGKAGVIAFNVWMAAVDARFQQAMDRFRTADGIVIDLRGNPGGLAAMIMGLSGHFLSERLTLGVMKTKDSELRFVANPRLVNAAGERVEPFRGPVAILIDGLSASASECFTGGLQSLGRARVFGQTSMGQALPALFDTLPNGDVLIHAWGDFVTGTGVRLEGRGVVPDEVVPATRADLLAGRDRPLEAALAWIGRGI
jgi:carboxyl-terminal processing protease